jgi:1-acyl-sn-glycerol-3-phosphate acyltransferase
MWRSLKFNLFFYGFTAGLAISSMVLLVLPRPYVVAMFKFWAQTVRWGLRVFADITMEFRHPEILTKALAQGPVIVASKHQSLLDTVMLNLLLPDPAIVMKQELLYVPFYGILALKAQMLVVNREGHAKALRKLMADSRAQLAKGRPIFIYPEGTRVWPGTKVDYKPGIAAMYNQLNLTCIPMALNTGLCWGPKEWAKRPGHIVFEFLEPIPPGLNRRSFMAKLEETIEAGSNRLMIEGQTSA